MCIIDIIIVQSILIFSFCGFSYNSCWYCIIDTLYNFFYPLRHDPAPPQSDEVGAPSSLQSEIETQPLDDSSHDIFHNLSIVRDSQEELANEVCMHAMLLLTMYHVDTASLVVPYFVVIMPTQINCMLHNSSKVYLC